MQLSERSPLRLSFAWSKAVSSPSARAKRELYHSSSSSALVNPEMGRWGVVCCCGGRGFCGDASSSSSGDLEDMLNLGSLGECKGGDYQCGMLFGGGGEE